MAITTKFLKEIMTEARPVIERQLADAKIVAGFREVVAANGGDWGALKALIKAHVEDELDEGGNSSRVQKILEKADSSTAYADMLGLANMNEKIYFAETNAEQGNVDGSAERAGRAGQDTENALSGQVESRNSDVVVDGNASLAAREGEQVAAFIPQSDDDAFAAVTVIDQLADAMGVEPSPSEPHVSARFGDEGAEQPEDGLSASGDLSEIDHSVAPPPPGDTETTAGEVAPPASPAAFDLSRSASLVADGGQPSRPSSDAGCAKMERLNPVPERAVAEAGNKVAKSEQAATISEADVPAFLKRKDGCLDQDGCKVKTYSILCARCAAERVRARVA